MQTDKMTHYQRGCLGERLVECYINDELIPLLKKEEGWSDVIFTRAWFKHTFPEEDEDCPESLKYPESLKKLEEEMEARLLIANGFCPTKEFLDYFKKLTASLSNTPDGFLIKMHRTGTSRSVKEAVEECEITSDAECGDMDNSIFKNPSQSRRLSVVDGKIEIVEVKSGESNRLQVDSYRTAVAGGYPLRLFHVDICLLEIREKLIVNPNEVVQNLLRKLDTFEKRWYF